MTPPVVSQEDDRELLRLLIKEAVSDGFAAHRQCEHIPLEEKVDQTRKQVWIGAGVITAVAALLKGL